MPDIKPYEIDILKLKASRSGDLVTLPRESFELLVRAYEVARYDAQNYARQLTRIREVLNV